jgi:putative ABC transport system permease protein
MIRHLFKLVWNRRRTNLLIVVELLCSFVVVFSLAAAAIYYLDLYRDPLGFDYREVWRVEVARNAADEYGQWSPEDAATFRRLLQAVESMDEVVAAAGSSNSPYGSSVTVNAWDYEKRKVEAEVSYVTPGFVDVLGMQLVSGRWILPEDSALDWTAVVVDQDLAFDLVGDDDPVGTRVGGKDEGDEDLRVVGLVRDFRRGGELNENRSYLFSPARLENDDGHTLRVLLLKLEPGTPADFEEPMLRALQSIARGWSFNVTHLESSRESHLKDTLTPLYGMALVAAFLLAMVVLGLTGVMWQNVTRRTREIGLRRAMGAPRVRIQRQIVGEVMVTASLGLIVGSLLTIQVPLMGPFAFLPYTVVVPALLASAALILLLAALCGFYPGWSASRIHPAEALHYE